MLDYKVPRKEWVRIREEVEPIIFVTNPGNPLADKEEVSFEEIIKEKLILMPPGEGYRYLFDDELAKRNLFVTPSIEIANTDTIMRLTRTSNYVTMLPVFEVRKSIEEGSLRKINVPECEFNQWSQLAYLKGKAMTPQLKVFIDTVLELLPPIID
ncbi:MAG: substrate-binding domain-containing protein, partial [Clostridia bacterium]|nr:substrate-binding domain-containing protein [Clostridia bacterium]